MPARTQRGEHLARSLASVDPDFDEAQWNKEWDALEAQMNADLVLLTTDKDFSTLKQLRQENWRSS